MKRFSFLLFIILSISIYAQTTYFLKFKESVDQSTIQMMVNQNSVFKASFTSSRQTKTSVSLPFVNTTGKFSNQLHRIIKITFSQNIPQADLTAQLTNPDIYEYIEPQKVYKTDGSVNDSLFNSQWALSKIKASGCWEITQGQDSIIIGVIDTGIDFNHPDIKNKLFINSGETGRDDFGYDKKNNSIDDDNNGFVDDFMGWDFTDRVGFPYDSTGGDYLGWDNIPLDENIFSHGTAVAGIIGAETNNLLGIAGVAPKIKILNLRAFDPDGNGEEDDVAAAVLYAVQMGVKVINMSFGDNSFSFVLRDVIRFAYANNVVLVASSGNTGSKNPHYPSGYSEVICVGNSTPEDYVASSSNFGSTLDLVAPGTGIITLSKGYNYAEFNGTSAAAPFVSAVAGLILSKQSFSNEEVKQILKTTSDDIGAEGWDEKSGSGRLNAEKALRVLAPSLIKFDYPFQDFTTASDTLQPSFSVLSPYFASCNVFWGEGLNPQAWKNLLANITNQGAAVKVPAINLKNSKDTVFTLRLQVVLTDGRTIEERVNFHKLSSAPQVTVFPIMPAYYGNSVSISTALYSTQPATAKMFYREAGSTEFRNNTLDGFTVNNLFVKQIHYGFVPPGYLKELTVYEVYFEVENLLGIKTIVRDSLGNNFTVRTNRAITQTSMNEMPYSLPTGIVFKDPIPIIAQGSTEILLSKSNDATKTFIYSLNNNEFTVRDSILQRIPKDAGDFNHDGKQEILANWGRNGYILSQSQNASTVFADVFKNEDGSFWPILVKDIDSDGTQELLAVLSDTTIGIYRVENDLKLTFLTSIKNFSTAIFGANVFDYPSAVIADIDKNGKNEIWVCDREGDVLCYNVNSAADITPDLNRSFRTEFLTSSSYLTIGDFDGDGNQDITIILHSIEELDIAKFYLVFTYTFFDDQLVPIFASAFIDPASEFNVFTRKAYNSVRMGKFFSTNKDDLLLCLFPYSFGFSYGVIDNTPVFFRENVNTNAVLAGDFNKNGIMEFGIALNDRFHFYEKSDISIPNTPVNFKGYSLDKNTLYMEWKKESPQYLIYKGAKKESLLLVDSVSTGYYKDTSISTGNNYFYAVKAKTASGQLSQYSEIISIYHHTPAKIWDYIISGQNNISLYFTERIKTGAAELSSFSLKTDAGQVIPAITCIPTGEKSMLINFSQSLTPGTYVLQMKKFSDYYGSPVTDTSFPVRFAAKQTDTLFYVESFQLLNSHQFKMVFNLPFDSASVLNSANYSFSPVNFIESISLDGINRAVLVTLKNGRPLGATGIESVLYLSNIYSSAASGRIAIKNKSAGSVLVFSKNAENIDNVYAYPNPVQVNKNNTVTFANLPKYAEIHIFAPTGTKIKTINENDGNGGVTWDLKDETGTLVQSGIYFFRVRQLDDNNEELHNKLFKFAVIR